MSTRWRTSRFDQEMEEPLGPLANLLDLMLVFAWRPDRRPGGSEPGSGATLQQHPADLPGPRTAADPGRDQRRSRQWL